MTTGLIRAQRYADAIRGSGLSIYDPVEVGDPQLWIPTPTLERLLDATMSGVSLADLPLRSRSKVVKERICQSLGYPVPPGFKRVRPRFPGQRLDAYAQKSNNLQIWNEQLEATRRYAIIRIGPKNEIRKVKVVTGSALASLDSTGTLTRKYQARLILGEANAELVSERDTDALRGIVETNVDLTDTARPASGPGATGLLPIQGIFDRLQVLIGESFEDVGRDQERNRGALLHKLVCQILGCDEYRDDGQFPDIRNQLLEVKLQTSPTIDLGLARPNSEEALDAPRFGNRQVRYRDVRYAVFYARTDGRVVTLTHLFLSTGEEFFARFPQFQGAVLNKKLQIPLPPDFFE